MENAKRYHEIECLFFCVHFRPPMSKSSIFSKYPQSPIGFGNLTSSTVSNRRPAVSSSSLLPAVPSSRSPSSSSSSSSSTTSRPFNSSTQAANSSALLRKPQEPQRSEKKQMSALDSRMGLNAKNVHSSKSGFGRSVNPSSSSSPKKVNHQIGAVSAPARSVRIFCLDFSDHFGSLRALRTQTTYYERK